MACGRGSLAVGGISVFAACAAVDIVAGNRTPREEMRHVPLMLFSPFSVRDATLRNRIVVPPMHQYSAVNGFPTDWHLVNAGKFAAGGAGLVVVESTKVERRGCGTIGDLGIWDDVFVEPLKRLVNFINAQGAVAGIQLGHSGRKARANRPGKAMGRCSAGPTSTTGTPGRRWRQAQSPIARNGRCRGRSNAVRSRTWCSVGARAPAGQMRLASRCWSCTGPTVISCTSSYPNVPISVPMNMAGSEHNRMRFIIEIAEEVRTHWPLDKPLFVRLSVEDNAGWGVKQSARLAKILKARGVDVIDCSSGESPTRRRSWARRSNTAIRCRCRNMSAATPIS
jgi:2,4-dienoyl-CoA reductase-like NADH-dependent reductase (Old Yellow Enzyme family)